MTEEKKYIIELRKRILRKIEDLRDKIKNDEDFPHGKQDMHSLVRFDDLIDECLNNWYY